MFSNPITILISSFLKFDFSIPPPPICKIKVLDNSTKSGLLVVKLDRSQAAPVPCCKQN